METMQKKPYEAPLAEVFSVVQEGIICASPDYAPNYNKPFNDEEEW